MYWQTQSPENNLDVILTGARSILRTHPSSPGAVVSSDGAGSGLDISTLVPTVQELFGAGIANSTQKVYKSGDRRYNNFCNMFYLSPYPVTESQLSYYVAYVA